MILTLSNGVQFNVNDESDLYQISMTTDTATMKEAVEEITDENLKHATMGDITFLNSIVNGISITSPNPTTGEVNVIFSLGEKSDIDIINERLDEQDAALMELAEMIAG
jgi:hypothetical protein